MFGARRSVSDKRPEWSPRRRSRQAEGGSRSSHETLEARVERRTRVVGEPDCRC
jgi:hypothetical protein